MTKSKRKLTHFLKKWSLVALAVVGITTGIAACTISPVETGPLPTGVLPNEATINPNLPGTAEVTPQVIPMAYQVQESGDSYTADQETLNNSESALFQKAVIERWLKYWVYFENRPFDLQTIQLTWKYIYDDPEAPTRVLVVIEANGDGGSRLISVPIGTDGTFAEFPPEVSGTDIQEGFEPLELTGWAEGQWLSVDQDGIPVIYDGSGMIVKKLDMDAGQWVDFVDPRWETPDVNLAEQIKSVMPVMWVYDREAKSFVERPANDFSFSIFERTTLYIYDKDGNEIGFARYFTRSTLDNENTEYYSLVDQSVHTIIPLRLYAQMGEFVPRDGAVTPQCIFAFSEDGATITGVPLDQTQFDYSQKYASDMIGIADGEELMQTALIRAAAMIKGVSEDEIISDIKNNVPVVISFGDKKWDVDQGIDFFWGDYSYTGFDVIDGKFISYDGSPSLGHFSCSLSVPGVGLLRAIGEAYGREMAYAFRAYLIPVVSMSEVRTPTITMERDR